MGRQVRIAWWRFSAVAVLVVLVAACASSGKLAQEPEWMSTYPQDERYYVGIGSSNTGNRSEDLERARAEALAQLAASISVEIRSETEYKEQEAGGEFASTVTNRISQTVDEHLQEVETVDSYYSPREGYWIYLRLNKREWARIQREEMERIGQRVRQVLRGAEEGSLAERLGALGKSLRIVRESAYFGMVRTTLAGEEGLLSDLIEARIAALLAGLRISMEPATIELTPVKTARVRISVQGEEGRFPGMWHLLLTPTAQGAAPQAERVRTGKEGAFTGRLAFRAFPLGEHQGEAKVDLSEYGLDEEGSELFRSPAAAFTIVKDPIKARLVVRSSGGQGVDGLEESVRAAVDELELPLSLSEEGRGAYTLEVAITFRDLPAYSEEAIYFTKVRAAISLLHEGSSIYSSELQEVKDGGIDHAQARARAFRKLMGTLREHPGLEGDIAQAIGL